MDVKVEASSEDLNEAARRMIVGCISKSPNRQSQCGDCFVCGHYPSPDRRTKSKDDPRDRRGRSRDKTRYKAPNPPNGRRHLSDVSESTKLETPLTRITGSSNGHQERLTLSVEGWNRGGPSLGPNVEKDRLTGWGQDKNPACH